MSPAEFGVNFFIALFALLARRQRPETITKSAPAL